LVVFVEGGGELKGRGLLVRHHDAREVDGCSFGEGRESFFHGDEGGGVVEVLAHRGTGRGDRGVVRCLF